MLSLMEELHAEPRTEVRKKVKSLRKQGFLPTVLYGAKVPSQPLKVAYKDFEKVYREAGESSLITVRVGDATHNVLIHEIRHHPLRGTPLHADFYAVQMDKAIRTKVQLEFVGEAPAVKEGGGILVKVMQEIEVEAFPQDLPHELRVDISCLGAVGGRVLVKDILLPKGVKILADPEETIALIEELRSEEEEVGKVAVPLEEVKTEREAKKEMQEKEEEETQE